MAHALLAVSRPPKRPAVPSLSSNNDADRSSSFASNDNNLILRHQHSIASASSTLYTCSEDDEQSASGSEESAPIDSAACEEVIQDSRLNGIGLPIPWLAHSMEPSTSSKSDKSRIRGANHAMRFKRKDASSRASLETLGQDWHPRMPSSSMDAERALSPSKSSSSSSTSSARRSFQSSCTCHVNKNRSNLSKDTLDEEQEGSASIDDQLDKMIRTTNDLLRVSKGVLASSKRVSVAKASESQVQHSYEHALRQHLESLETQDRFMHYVSNEAHSILTSIEQAQSPLSPLHSSLPRSCITSPPNSRGRLRPHSSNGSISAPAIQATTMYINAEMGSVMNQSLKGAEIERHVGSTSQVTCRSSLGSAKEQLAENSAGEMGDVRETSTPAHMSKLITKKTSHLSELSVASSHGILQQVTSASSLSAPNVSTMTLSPTLSLATANSSTPSSTFFSSFWSRSNTSTITNASSNTSTLSSPNSTMNSSPSLTRFLARKSAPPGETFEPHDGKKDAKGMLSALAASSPPMPRSDPDASSSSPHSNALSSIFVPPTSPTDTTNSMNASSPLFQHLEHEARSPPLSGTTSTAALAQLSAIHSSPHLTVSSRPRHRTSLSESLLRASWSGNNLKSEVATAKAVEQDGVKSHKRTRHSTSPGVQFQVPVSKVPISHKKERSGRVRE